MLSDKAVEHYRKGYSCARCIIRAAEDEYGIKAGDTSKALSGVNNGFGIGAMCCVSIACIMVLGILFDDENQLKAKRLEFLMRFKKKFNTLNCAQIQKNVLTCDEVIRASCDILDDIVRN